MSEVFKLHTKKVVSRGMAYRKIEKIEAPVAHDLPKTYVSGCPAAYLEPCEPPELRLYVVAKINKKIRKMSVWCFSDQINADGSRYTFFKICQGKKIPEKEFQVFISHLEDAATRLRKVELEVAYLAERWNGKEVFLF